MKIYDFEIYISTPNYKNVINVKGTILVLFFS